MADQDYGHASVGEQNRRGQAKDELGAEARPRARSDCSGFSGDPVKGVREARQRPALSTRDVRELSCV
jgi:hypothetical protein